MSQKTWLDKLNSSKTRHIESKMNIEITIKCAYQSVRSILRIMEKDIVKGAKRCFQFGIKKEDISLFGIKILYKCYPRISSACKTAKILEALWC